MANSRKLTVEGLSAKLASFIVYADLARKMSWRSTKPFCAKIRYPKVCSPTLRMQGPLSSDRVTRERRRFT
jgi:hypothetical protein